MITRNRWEIKGRKEKQGWEELKREWPETQGDTNWPQGIWKSCQPVELVNLMRTTNGGHHYKRSRNICGKHHPMENTANGTSFCDVGQRALKGFWVESSHYCSAATSLTLCSGTNCKYVFFSTVSGNHSIYAYCKYLNISGACEHLFITSSNVLYLEVGWIPPSMPGYTKYSSF